MHALLVQLKMSLSHQCRSGCGPITLHPEICPLLTKQNLFLHYQEVELEAFLSISGLFIAKRSQNNHHHHLRHHNNKNNSNKCFLIELYFVIALLLLVPLSHHFPTVILQQQHCTITIMLGRTATAQHTIESNQLRRYKIRKSQNVPSMDEAWDLPCLLLRPCIPAGQRKVTVGWVMGQLCGLDLERRPHPREYLLESCRGGNPR